MGLSGEILQEGSRARPFGLAAAVLTWFTTCWFALPLRTRLRESAADDRRPDDNEPPG